MVHERNFMIHREPPGKWGVHGRIVAYDRRVVPKLTDHVKPTLKTLEPGRYVFFDAEGYIQHGVLIEKLKDGAVMEQDTVHVPFREGLDGGEWKPKRVVGRVRTSQIIATEEEFERRIPIYDKLVGGKLIALGYPAGQEPDDLWQMHAEPPDADLGRPDLPMF